ncbi:MAG: hypothetical protein LJE63_07630 [Desulfobacteraceae bacterium]|nr:hypothetical protein [Desulfobacteraceae bacterium]
MGASTGKKGPAAAQRSQAIMDISRRLAILVVFGVPVIVGGGIVFALFGDLKPVLIYQVLLLLVAGALVSR